MRKLCFRWQGWMGIVAILGLATFAPVANAQDVFTVGNGPTEEVSDGDAVSFQVLFDTIGITQGWSFGVCNDAALITFIDAVPGATTLTVNNGGEPDFLQLNALPPDGVAMGVVISFLGMATLPPGTGYEILDLSYEIAMIDPPLTEPTPADVCFCDTLGDPPVATVIVVGGQSIIPTQVCGTATVAPPPDYCIDPFECVAGTDNVTITWDSCTPFEYYVLNKDGELLSLLDPTDTEFVDFDVMPGVSYTYDLIGVAFPEPTGPAVIEEELCEVTVISVEISEIQGASGFFYGGDTVTILGMGFTSAPNLEVTFGANPGTDLMVVSDSELTVVTPAADALGTVDITVTNDAGTDTAVDAFLYGFVRGDIDCNTAVDIGDAQGLLLYLFLAGDPPCCFDAADANDDGTLNAADPISILAHLFDGGPALPAPFPQPLPEILDPASVGLDPTDDDPLICF